VKWKDSKAIHVKIISHTSLNSEDFVVDIINKMIPSKATVEEEDRNRASHEKYCTQQREGEKRLTLIRDMPIFIDFLVEIVNDYRGKQAIVFFTTMLLLA
jgi:hypothetical protein